MSTNKGLWSEDEHDRFLEALQIYPHGPWRFVAKHVATRDVRQVQTHAQKYYEKIGRHLRGLHKERRTVIRAEHRIEGFPLPHQQPLEPVGALANGKPLLHTLSSCRQDVTATVSAAATATVPTSCTSGAWLTDDDVPLPLLDADTLLPSLEESLDILLQCFSDSY